jgi:fucose permease
VQSGRHDVGGVGTQATVALILTLVQGFGPPTGLLSAVDRLAGMLGALGLMLIAALLFGPAAAGETL